MKLRKSVPSVVFLLASAALIGVGSAAAADPPPFADPDLQFWFAEDGNGPGQLGEVIEIASGGGRIAVGDYTNDVVHVYLESGVFLRDLGSSGIGPGQFQSPSGIALTDAGRTIVTDNDLDRVSVYGPNGQHKFDFGSTGSGPGLFSGPSDVIVDSGGDIYVADFGNDRIQVFDSAGEYIKSIGPAISGGPDIDSPVGLDFTTDGLIAVRNGVSQHVVSVVNDDAEHQFTISASPTPGTLTVDDRDRFWMSTTHSDVVVRDRNDRLLGLWEQPSFISPVFDSKGLAVIPSPDSGGRINVYSFHQCNGKLATYVGTPGDDSAVGTNLADVAVLRGGNDLFFGGPGRDTICGGPGADILHGGPGLDWLYGQGGPDELNGNGQKDRLFGGNGLDVLRGGYGPDWLYGGNHADELRGGDGPDNLFGGNGPDDCFGGPGTDAAASCATETGIP